MSLLPYVAALMALALVAGFCEGRLRAGLLVVASFVFYASLDWRFPFILAGIIAVTYLGGLHLDGGRRGRGAILAWTVVTLAPLAFYKYLLVWLADLSRFVPVSGLEFGGYGAVLIPAGLSFYSFQCLGYLIDVHRRAYPADRDPLRLALFISFFPQLLAGPIERYATLAPALWEKGRPNPDMVMNGLVLIAWGLFVKLAVGDRLAGTVDIAYANAAAEVGGAGNTLIGFVGFTLQLFADFGGYSLIAVGAGMLFGVELTHNFRQPFFSSNVVEFWQRWHISLTRWVGDYVYRPLGRYLVRRTAWAARQQEAATAAIVWTVLGLWHGAQLTFVVFGMTQAAAIIGYKAIARRRGRVPAWRTAVGMAVTFAFVVVTFGLIRAPDLSTFLVMSGDLLSAAPGPFKIEQEGLTFACIAAMLAVELRGRFFGDAVAGSLAGRSLTLAGLAVAIMLLGNEAGRSFIYFRF